MLLKLFGGIQLRFLGCEVLGACSHSVKETSGTPLGLLSYRTISTRLVDHKDNGRR